jgi:hypothetical protein
MRPIIMKGNTMNKVVRLHNDPDTVEIDVVIEFGRIDELNDALLHDGCLMFLVRPR